MKASGSVAQAMPMSALPGFQPSSAAQPARMSASSRRIAPSDRPAGSVGALMTRRLPGSVAARGSLHWKLLEVRRERMHPPRAVLGDRDGLGEYAAGLAVVPLRIEQIDIHREHHAGPELVADRLQRAFVGAERVVAVARIFQ